MATYAAYAPQALITAPQNEPEIFMFTPGSTAFVEGMFVKTPTAIVPISGAAGTGVATNLVIGLAAGANTAVYQNVSGQPVASQLFGTGQNLNTVLFPGDQIQVPVVMAHFNQLFEITTSVAAGNAFGTLVVGAQVGVAVVSSICVADASATNKVATVVGIGSMPVGTAAGQSSANGYATGDLGWRAIIQFLPVGTGTIM